MALHIEPLLQGEQALEGAPQAQLSEGRLCIPQHYLHYQHTLATLEAIVLDIEFDSHYPIFASRDSGGIYIQIGVIGVDNYRAAHCEQNIKIVYGRKWRVEPQLPTSEIIQTIFLALKKAREHEIRELLRLNYEGKITTPFNNHQDLPLLTHSRNRLETTKEIQPDLSCAPLTLAALKGTLIKILNSISYNEAKFILSNVIELPDNSYFVGLMIQSTSQQSSIAIELLASGQLHLVLQTFCENHILQQIMQQLIILSDRYVDENFFYRNFNRFSWQHNLKAIAQLSSTIRQLHKQPDAKPFLKQWLKNNDEVDRSRVPAMEQGALSSRLKQQLATISMRV